MIQMKTEYVFQSLTPFTSKIVTLHTDTFGLFISVRTFQYSMSNFVSYKSHGKGLSNKAQGHAYDSVLFKSASSSRSSFERKKCHFKLPLARPLYSLISKMIRTTPRNPVVVVVGGVVAITFIKCMKPENASNCTMHAVYVARLCVDYKKEKMSH